jgi:hypothetical protein
MSEMLAPRHLASHKGDYWLQPRPACLYTIRLIAKNGALNMRHGFLLQLVLILFAVKLSACPAGYESPESLVRHARLIVQIEVLAVEEAPLPPTMQVRHPDEDFGRKTGQAHVKILQVIKGKCAAREFTLISGPYHTCAPSLYYHSLQMGDKLILILESPLPNEVKIVAVTWRNRLIKEGVDRIREFMKNAHEGWKLAVERHRRAAPDDMAQAELLHAEFIKNPTYKAPSKASYGVLSCLAVLSNDPDRLPTEEPVEPDNEDRWSGYSNSFFGSFYASQKAYVTAYGSHTVMPIGMRDVFPKRIDFGYTPPPEARQFNERILKTILEDELFVPPALSADILKKPELKVMWDHPQADPFWLKLDRPRRGSETADAMALYYLMLLADPEPDGLVWGTFGISADKATAFLPTDLFVGFIEHNQQRIFDDWGALKILILLPHSKIARMVRAHVAKGVYDRGPDALIRYFVQIGSEPDILNAVGLMEKNVDKFVQSMAKPGRDKSGDNYTCERYRKETKDSLKDLGSPGTFKLAEQRLKKLSERLASVQIASPH